MDEIFYENCQSDMDGKHYAFGICSLWVRFTYFLSLEYYQNDMDGRHYAFTVEFTQLGFSLFLLIELFSLDFLFENYQLKMNKIFYEHCQSDMDGKHYAFGICLLLVCFTYFLSLEYYQNDMNSRRYAFTVEFTQLGFNFLLFEKVIPESYSTFDPEQSTSGSLHNEYRGTDENVNNNLMEE
ncbi:hypothetical protein F8M41_012967 [Gigaspora margarita]|uniref:Uncharacterized protein n=1 Tax=Gigaspora margarita TaxID=4874 RepID=A0A8H4ASN8_GIGMA|nr:hypothetical protein F8M41_012967 [Gigaspora margarita]